MDRRLDDTKRSIGVHGLQDQEKKELFTKFQQHGGEVIKERDPDPAGRASRAQQRGALARRTETPPREPAASERRPAPSRQARPAEAKKSEGGLGLFFERTSLWFRSVFGGVMQSGGGCLASSFFKFLHNKAQTRLLNLGLLVVPLAHANSELRALLRAELAKLGPYHFEYILRLDRVYDETLLRALIDANDPKGRKNVSLRSVSKPLTELYKRIYIMRNFSQSVLAALTRALEVQGLMENRDATILARELQRAKQCVNFVFDELFEKLHIAVLNILKRNFDCGHPELEKFLNLTDEDQIGSLTESLVFEQKEGASEGADALDEEAEDAGGESKPQAGAKRNDSDIIYVLDLPEPVQAGFAIMRKLDFSDERKIAGQEMALALMGEDSKMFCTQILFEILDREYSFVLTSNKIKIALDYQGGERKDIRKSLGDAYFALDETRNNIKEYNHIITERQSVENSPQLTPLQKSQTIHRLDRDRSKLDNQIRNRFGLMLGDIESALGMLIDDTKGANHLLQNPEEILHFVLSGDKKRRLEGCSVIEAITETFVFVSALRFRLREGDLAGLGAKVEQAVRFESGRSQEQVKSGSL